MEHKRLMRPAAVSIVALASLAGAPSANAQEVPPPPDVCLDPCVLPPPPGIAVAFSKIAANEFPGKTEFVFLKLSWPH